MPGEGRLRISEAPNGDISSGADTFLGFYADDSKAGLRGSDSGSITIVDREGGLLEAHFHFTAAFPDGSGYLSILGAFAAEEADAIDAVSD